MIKYTFGMPYSGKPDLGDLVQLQRGKPLEVVSCEETGVKMLNIDADEILPGDLRFIKRLGLTISNPDTDRPVALGVDYEKNSWGEKINEYLEGDDEDDDDDFFDSGSFLGGLGSIGFGGSSGGGFGGFGGGGFSGGGASRSF